MDFYVMSDRAIEVELGKRIKSLRLEKNITQTGLASLTMLSLNAIKSLESGRGKLSTIIAVLRALSALDNLNDFLPPVPAHSVSGKHVHGIQRQRASGFRGIPKRS